MRPPERLLRPLNRLEREDDEETLGAERGADRTEREFRDLDRFTAELPGLAGADRWDREGEKLREGRGLLTGGDAEKLCEGACKLGRLNVCPRGAFPIAEGGVTAGACRLIPGEGLLMFGAGTLLLGVRPR